MGPLYAYQHVAELTRVRPLEGTRFDVGPNLPPDVFPNSVTLEFVAPGDWELLVSGRSLSERSAGAIDRWDGEYFRRDGERVFVTVRPGGAVEFRKK